MLVLYAVEHFSTQCRSQHRCPIYKNRRFVILCPDLPSHKVNEKANVEKVENKTSTLYNYVKVSGVFLQTLIVKIQNGSKQKYIRTVCDTGFMKSYDAKILLKL